MSAQVGDIGTVIRLSIVDSAGTAVNVATATTKEIHAQTPAGVDKTWKASFVTDGSNGQISYTTTSASDLDEAGVWQVQAYIVTPAGTWHSSTETLVVYENL